MTIRQAFLGMLQLLAVGFALAVGICLLGLYLIPEFSFALEQSLIKRSGLFLILGLASIGFSAILGCGFYCLSYGRTLLLRMGTSVDVKLIRQIILPLFYKEFSDRVSLRDVQVLQGKELLFGLQFASMSAEERDKLLLKAEHHLQTVLVERLGCKQPFTVQASI